MFVLLIVISCFLLLVSAFDKLPAFKTGKEKRATSPKIKQFMPKISETAYKIKKGTDIFGINPIVSICLHTTLLIHCTPSQRQAKATYQFFIN